jgi:hypothetical protein
MTRIISCLIFTFLVSVVGCSNDCDGENPTVKLVNSGTGKADIQIKTSGGNTENINNIESGTSSAPRSFAPGEIEFTIAIQGVSDPVVYNLPVVHCVDYTVTINGDNSVSASAQERD